MKKSLILRISFLTLFFLFFPACEKTQGSKIIREGDSAPEFSLTSFDGRVVKLSDYRGKVVLVHFWATWCPPCVEEIPTLDSLNRALFSKDFEILAVSVDEGGAAAVSAFMNKNKLTLPVLLDPQRSIAGLYGTFKFPETYLVDRQGIVREKVIGPRNWAIPENQTILLQVIGSK